MVAYTGLALPETTRGSERLIATYHLRLPDDADVIAKAAGFAIGQTIGTWLPVPGITPELRARHQGEVVGILPSPALDVDSGAPEAPSGHLVRIALPTVNFGPSLPAALTALLGNDSSTSVEAKLVDLEIPDDFARALGGPRHGVAGVRDLVGVHDRPLLLNMIKPCTGLTPTSGAEIFYQTALGGVDLIKDDELLADPEYSPVVERVVAYNDAARRAYEETGHTAMYIPNVTDRPIRTVENARRAVDAGARAVMVTYATVGYGGLQDLAEAIEVPILGHFAGTGPYFEGPRTGMSAALAAGMLPRLAGADLILMTTPYSGYPIRRLSYLRTAQQIAAPRPHIARALPVIGGGVHPGTVARYVEELGPDIVLGVGGAIQGHPGGPAAGVRAMRQAIDAAMRGEPARAAAAARPELAQALDAWGEI